MKTLKKNRNYKNGKNKQSNVSTNVNYQQLKMFPFCVSYHYINT